MQAAGSLGGSGLPAQIGPSDARRTVNSNGATRSWPSKLASVRGLPRLAPIYAALILPAPVHSPDAAAGRVNISPWCLLIATVVGAIVLVSFAAALGRAGFPNQVVSASASPSVGWVSHPRHISMATSTRWA